MDATSFAGSLMIAHQRSSRSNSEGSGSGLFGSSNGSGGSYNGSSSSIGSTPSTSGNYFPQPSSTHKNSYDEKRKVSKNCKNYSPF